MAPPGKRGNSEASRILFIRNLPFKATGADLYKIFARYGKIRQVRIGNGKTTKGTAFVVYNEISEARTAMDALAGFNVDGRYLVVYFFHPSRKRAAPELDKQRQEVEELRNRYRLVEESMKTN